MCSTCDDTGRVYATNLQKVVSCPHCDTGREIATRLLNSQFRAAGLPETYKGLSFATWEQHVNRQQWTGKLLAFGMAQHFAYSPFEAFAMAPVAQNMGGTVGDDIPRKGLVLTGAYGLGKTGLLAAVANSLLEQGRGVLYIRVQDLFIEIQSTYRSDSQTSSRDKIQQAVNAPVLLLDDVNVANLTNDKREIMEAIVRGRDGNGLPSMLTTNLGLDEFYQAWGGRIADITAKMHWVKLGGLPLRQTVRAEVEGF